MAKVQGVKEKLHSPLYDAFFVPGPIGTDPNAKKFSQVMTDSRMIRFFVDVQNKTRLETNLQASGVLPSLNTFEARAMRVVVSSLHRSGPGGKAKEREEPELVQDLIYNSVTTLIVGEKIMIEMPSFYFPSGAGVISAAPTVSNHGEPSPEATFRFAEPVFIEPQQNFRVEMLFPQGVPLTLQEAEGPIRIGSSWTATSRGMSSDQRRANGRNIMRNLSEDEASRMMGLEDVGDVYQGADGHLYEWVAGVDGDGEQVGFWQGLSLSDAPALDGLGALYATPDGTVYQVQGLGDEEADPKARAARKRPGPPPPRPGPGAERRAAPEEGRVLQEVVAHREIRLPLHPRTWRRSHRERWHRRGRQASEEARCGRLRWCWRSVRSTGRHHLPGSGSGGGGSERPQRG